MSYPTADAYLARQTPFYDFCNQVADSYMEEYGNEPYEGYELEEHVCEWLGYDCYDMMTADAEDLIASYGMTKAIHQYHDLIMKRIQDEDIQQDQYAHALLHDIAGEPVINRVKGLIQNRQASS